MSDKQKNVSPTGKSLAIMQQRLLSKTDSEEARGTPMPPPPGGHGQQPTTQAAAATSAAPPGRPKGKDFAAMAMNAKASSPPAPAPPTAPTTASPASVAPNRPKGKDFSAMANRMPQQPVHPLDPDRAAKMQAEARAAAGLPPLVQPTATSVTMVPPPIAAPGVPGPKGPTPMTIDPRRQSVPVARQETNRAVPQQAVRRNAMTRPPPAPAAATSVAVPQPPKPNPKPTAQPTPAEARLSLAAGTLGTRPGGPHQSPLVGQRLRDLVASLDPNYVLDSQAEEQVLQLADDFLDKVTRQAIRLAQHRGSRTLDVQDVQLALSKQWGIVVPGLGPPVLRPTKPANRAPAATGTKRRSSSKEGGAAKKAKTNATKLS